MTTANNPNTAWLIETSEEIDKLLADNQLLIELTEAQSDTIHLVIHDLRGLMTNLNLHIYMLERLQTPEQSKHFEELRATIAIMKRLLETLEPQS